MGYYTYYNLSVGTNRRLTPIHDEEKKKQVYLAFAKIPYFYYEETDEDILSNIVMDPVDEINHDFLCNDMKWYDHDNDLIDLSLKFPDLYFMIDCYGEDNTFWRVWYHNGKSSVCESRLVYDEPNWDYLEGGNDQTGTCTEN